MSKNILFLSRTGLLEPLGQSQILTYLSTLSKDYCISIITFEKVSDLNNATHVDSIQKICEANEISWSPIKYRDNLRYIGAVVGFYELFFKTLKVSNRQQINCIHLRSYYPIMITLLMHRFKKIPFIFDMRALWPEELVESGRLRANGISWKLIKYLEKKCLQKAAAVVSLTYAALDYLDKQYPVFKLKEKTTVIPTCADLKRFDLKEAQFDYNKITISCVGSMLTGWFKIDILKTVIHYLLDQYENVNFEFLTRDDKTKLFSKLDLTDHYANRISFASVLFEDMPNRIAKHDGSVFFFTPGVAKLGSAPTRMAELLGTGIPVLTNSGVGDVGSIIKDHNVGVLIALETVENIKKSCDEFINLISQKDIDKECRYTAVKLFSLESGVERYRAIYKTILNL